jgi:capsular exopolysaccharide synthesis family protein
MEQGSDLHLGELLRIVQRRIWVVVLFFVVVVSVVAIGTFRATPVYEAVARLVIERPSTPSLPVEELLGNISTFDAKKYYQTQYSLLRGKRMLRDLMSSIPFSSWPEYEGLKDEDILSLLEDRIQVEPQEDSFLVDVKLVGQAPEAITQAVNRLVKIYMDRNDEATRETIATGATFLEREIPQLQEKLEESFRKLSSFQENNNVLSDEESKGLIIEEIKGLRASVAALEERLEELEGRNLSLGRAREGSSPEVMAMILGDKNVQDQIDQLRQEKRALEQQASLLSSRPSYVRGELEALLAQVRSKDVAMKEEIRMALLKLETELEETRRLYASRKEREGHLFQESQRLYRTLNEFKRLQDVYQRNYVLFDQFIQRHNELAAARNARPNNIRVEFPAEVPTRPVRPRKALNLALALVVGLIGGLLLAFFFEILDDTIKGREDVRRILRLPPLGFVPAIEGGRRAESGIRDLITYKSPQSVVSEAYRSIRTGIAFSGAGNDRQVVLITSASPREGKTTTAINVAVAMAQSGQKTLLIDTDLRRPRIHQTFQFENSRGLTSVFINDFRIEEVIMPTEVENLYVLPSGPIPPNPSELLGSPRMAEILTQLRSMFGKIVLDSPPTVAVTDASILGQLADSTILVVSAHTTRKKIASQGKENLQSLGVNLSGVILNNMKSRRQGYYYSGYYYNHYGADRGDDEG